MIGRFSKAGAALAILLFCAAGCGDNTRNQSQTKTGGGGTRTGTGTGGAGGVDQDFVTTAASAGMAEVETGKLALERASREDVKRFAQKMVDDHGKANRELLALAKQKNIPVSERMNAEHQAAVDKLSKLKGAEFDKAYIKIQVDEHVKAVELFEGESKNGNDADLKGFASKTLPTLQEHLKMARAMAAGKGSAAHKE
jgi:putative membrane protein